MSNRRTLKEVKKLIRWSEIAFVTSLIITILAMVALGYLCHTATVPSCLSAPNGMLAAGPLLSLVAVIISATGGGVFSAWLWFDIPERWLNGDM